MLLPKHCQGSSNSIQHVLLLLSWLLLHNQCSGSSSQLVQVPPQAATAAAAAGATDVVAPACTTAPAALRIPRIIHRNYMEGRAAMYAATQVDNPSWQLHWLLSCKAHHPAWAEMVWNESDILGLITEEYPWFLATYQTYTKHVFRSDLARFVILHKHGGVYLDADVECYKNMEPSLAGLDLVINCRTYDVAHNAAMASVAGHPVWITAMKAAMAVVQRLSPGVSGDPLTATGPVLMSQAVQQYYGISKEQFCNRLHVKDGLILKAYPKGHWFTPCWPWANLPCYKKLETERKFLVRSDPMLEHIVGVHHYSGTWFGQASNSKDRLRQRNRMLAAEATVSFLWESSQFVEYKCGSVNKSAALGSSASSAAGASGDSGQVTHRWVHTRPEQVGAAGATGTSAVVRRLRRLLHAPQPAAAAATAAAATAKSASAGAQTISSVTSPTSGMFSCPAVRQLASRQPCMVLSLLQPTSSQQSAALVTQPPQTTAADASHNSSTYWDSVDSMLSTWQQSLGCQVTVVSAYGASLPSKLVQLAPTKAATHVDQDTQLQPSWLGQQSYLPLRQQQQQGRAVTPPAAIVVEAPAATSAIHQHAAPDAAQHLVHLLQQQQALQLHALGCDQALPRHNLRVPPVLTCKAPPRHTALHLSGSADYLLDLARQIYSYNMNVSHSDFEQHGRYSGAMHSQHKYTAAVHSSTGNTAASAQSVITVLDTVDILLVDVEQPNGPTAHSQGWSVLYNLLYQVHDFVGFLRDPLPDGRKRLGWIRRPERLSGLGCIP